VKAAAAQRAKGRLTVRERIALLVDPVGEGRTSHDAHTSESMYEVPST